MPVRQMLVEGSIDLLGQSCHLVTSVGNFVVHIIGNIWHNTGSRVGSGSLNVRVSTATSWDVGGINPLLF